MNRVVFALLAGILCCNPAWPQRVEGQNQLDASQALFTTLAAINAAGYDGEADSPNNSPLRKAVRDYLVNRPLTCLPDLKKFFAEHRQNNWNAELSQYISYGLSIGDPPLFEYRYKAEDLPPDVKPLDGLSPLLTRFYQEADIATLWKKSQPAFSAVLEQYHLPVLQAVQKVSAYLRSPMSGYPGRHFQIYISLLGAPNQIHTRSYLDDYFVVLTPSPDPQIDEIRHAYLHYLLDPLAFKFTSALDTKRGLIDYAQAAPALEDYYKQDFLMLATECLIRAIEARLAPGGVAARQALVTEALREGLVVTPAFYDLLPEYEKQERAMRYDYPDLVKAIDLRKEAQRLDNIQFVDKRPSKSVKVVVPAERKVELTGPYKTFEDAQNFYAARQLDKARETYLKVLQEPAGQPLHAKAYYGLARIAALQRNPELAEKLFQKALELSPDVETRSWCQLYLGRLADARRDRQGAEEHYRAVLALPAAPQSVRKAAEQGLKESFDRKP